MTWYGLVDADGDLVSVGTEAMFEGGVVQDPYLGYSVHTFGDQPDFAQWVWDKAGRRLLARPVPVLVDRLEDIRVRLEADPDWSVELARLTTARRAKVFTGLNRVLDQVLGGHRYRGESEDVEI